MMRPMPTYLVKIAATRRPRRFPYSLSITSTPRIASNSSS